MIIKKDIEKIEKKIDKGIKKVEKKVGKEVKEVEAWMIERRKFLIKLGWVAGGIIVLLIVSRLYLSVGGFG